MYVDVQFYRQNLLPKLQRCFRVGVLSQLHKARRAFRKCTSQKIIRYAQAYHTFGNVGNVKRELTYPHFLWKPCVSRYLLENVWERQWDYSKIPP